MSSFSDLTSENLAELSSFMMPLIEELYPICRSITGDGVRQTLKIVGRIIPLELHEVKSGTQVFDTEKGRRFNGRNPVPVR